MEAMYFLLPISIVLVIIIVCVLLWATGAGQFDDLDAPGERMLLDDDETADAPVRSDKGEP